MAKQTRFLKAKIQQLYNPKHGQRKRAHQARIAESRGIPQKYTQYIDATPTEHGIKKR